MIKPRRIARHRKRPGKWKAGGFIIRAAVLILCAILLRQLLLSDVGQGLQGALQSVGGDPGVARQVFSYEVDGLGSLRSQASSLMGWGRIFSSSSVLFSYYDEQVSQELWTSEGHDAYADWVLSLPDAPALSVDSISPDPLPSAPEEATPSPTIEEVWMLPVSESGYNMAENVYIRNETGFDIDVVSILSRPAPITLSGEGPHVLIVHTHGSEAYQPDADNPYVPTDTERTEDTNFNVVRIGDEVAQILADKGLTVVHDRNIYDYPSYSGSYTRTLEAITAQMKETPSIKVVIDIHRDSIADSAGTVFSPVAEVEGQKAAQIMLVMGTGEKGLPHPNWRDNLTLATALQAGVEQRYPGLMRPINLRGDRFNQHVTRGSMLVEVGASGNTLEQALYGSQLFADCLGDLLVRLKK